MIDYEDLRLKIKDRLNVHDLVDLLGITEDDLLDEFKGRVFDEIREIYEVIEYDDVDEGEVEE